MMNSGSNLHSVYIFQLIDTILSPSTIPAESVESPEDMKKDWGDIFNITGGFKAVCRFIASGLRSGSSMPRQGWKALLRILRVCLSRDSTLVKESVNLSGKST
jgi:hypothetical protein